MIDFYPIRFESLLLEKLRHFHHQYFDTLVAGFALYLLIEIIFVDLVNARSLQQVLPLVLICLHGQHSLEIAFLLRLELDGDRQYIADLGLPAFVIAHEVEELHLISLNIAGENFRTHLQGRVLLVGILKLDDFEHWVEINGLKFNCLDGEWCNSDTFDFVHFGLVKAIQ